MKEAETPIPIPCLVSGQFVCRDICTLFPNSADAFWESVCYDQNSPEKQRQIIIEEALSTEPNDLKESVAEILKSTGKLQLCKSYLEGC